MLIDIVDNPDYSNNIKKMYNKVLKHRYTLDVIFESIYTDIQNVYPETTIGEGGNRIFVTIQDITTADTVKTFIQNTIETKLKQHKIDIVPAIAFRTVYCNSTDIQISKRY